MASIFIDRKWLYGGPWDLWVRQHDMIEKLVGQLKIKPVPVERLPFQPQRAFVEPDVQTRPGRPTPFPGGMRSPHLHMNGDVFMLNQAQWKSFCDTVIKDYGERLRNVSTVGFDEMMELAAAVEAL